MNLELDDIQYLVLARAPAITGRYELLSFRDAAAGRKWLAALVDKVPSVEDATRSAETDRRWISVAFTWNGLRALGVSEDWYVAVACDGRRSRVDGGLSLSELADLMVALGAESAINLDGGGSTTLVHRRHLLNRPYSTQDQAAPESRPIMSALVFEPAERSTSSTAEPGSRAGN